MADLTHASHQRCRFPRKSSRLCSLGGQPGQTRWGTIIFQACLGLCCWLPLIAEHGLADENLLNLPRNSSAGGEGNDPDAFTFVRIRYESTGGYGESWYRHEGRDWDRWETDFPRGELNLLFRLNQLTSLKVNPEPIVLRLTDPDIMEHPFVFMSDVGWQFLTDREIESLREYLDNGGFLWVDDFWGEAEWRNLVRNTSKLGDQWQWQLIPADHEILKCVYPLQACPQIPARVFFDATGLSYDPPLVHRSPAGGVAGVQKVHFMGLFDQQERLAAVATHNTDIADGWEREGEDREFFTRFSIQSYAITINIITYAMTH